MKTIRLKANQAGVSATIKYMPDIDNVLKTIEAHCLNTRPSSISRGFEGDKIRLIREFADNAHKILSEAQRNDPAAFAKMFGDCVTMTGE